MSKIESIAGQVFDLMEKELPADITYHTRTHTEDVVDVALKLAALYNIDEHDTFLLHIACLFHDTGFTKTYRGHEEESIVIFQNSFENGEFSEDDKTKIEGMIRATKIPQQPHNMLERIICDADLDYLGRDDFYTTGKLLYHEFLSRGFVEDWDDWNQTQIQFLSQHSYHTSFAVANRQAEKDKRLCELRNFCDSEPN